jgi:hypothetical protein
MRHITNETTQGERSPTLDQLNLAEKVQCAALSERWLSRY